MAENPKDRLSEAQVVKRRDAVLKKMLNTPPKPHKLTGGKPNKAGNKNNA